MYKIYPYMTELKSKCKFLESEVEAKLCELYFLGRHAGESKRVEYVYGKTLNSKGALLVAVVPLCCWKRGVIPGL